MSVSNEVATRTPSVARRMTAGSAAAETALVPLSAAAETRWLRLLSRWALLLALAFVALLVAFFLVIAGAGKAPQAYAELVAASHNLALYRLAAGLDVLVWLGLGGSLLAFAALLARHAPVRAAFIAACAAGQVVGALGGF